ncbi:hypothetical protein LTR28_003535 [Elasticomyces elasticus]|nr:hypothetical protein LTR28_003535 [Elasticomyces elasticus]
MNCHSGAGPSGEQKDELVLQKKKMTSIETLCDGLPKAFVSYFCLVRSLRFKDTPNYEDLRKTFQNLFVREGSERDNVSD